MEDRLLCFRNPHTGKISQKVQAMDGFVGWAYDDCVKFAEKRETAPSLTDALILTETTPQIGERRYVLVRYPFMASLGDSINILYGTKAVIHGTFERILCQDEEKAWIEMKITQVDALGDLVRRYPPVVSQTMSDEVYWLVNSMDAGDSVPGVELYVRKDSWEYVMMETTTGMGNWFLLYHDQEGEYHLILYGVYDQDWEFVQFGNCIIQYILPPVFEGMRRLEEYIEIKDSPIAQQMIEALGQIETEEASAPISST